tara:strand:- start:7246 stop:7599 length:354 start_codon:yes stop_codon:yes gene_type:complete
MVNLLLFKDIIKLIHGFININNNFKINKFIDYTKKNKNNYKIIYDNEFYSIYNVNHLGFSNLYKNMGEDGEGPFGPNEIRSISYPTRSSSVSQHYNKYIKIYKNYIYSDINNILTFI